MRTDWLLGRRYRSPSRRLRPAYEEAASSRYAQDQPKRSYDGQLATAISNEVVRVIGEYTGRGPTRARTYLHEDLISVVVQDALTKGERSLVEDGKPEAVMSVRKEFQDTMRRDLVAAVEDLTARKVIAFFSANHIDPDAGLESFLLAPRADGQRSSDADAIGDAQARPSFGRLVRRPWQGVDVARSATRRPSVRPGARLDHIGSHNPRDQVNCGGSGSRHVRD